MKIGVYKTQILHQILTYISRNLDKSLDKKLIRCPDLLYALISNKRGMSRDWCDPDFYDSDCVSTFEELSADHMSTYVRYCGCTDERHRLANQKLILDFLDGTHE